jgi:hypothetical protein
MFKNEDVCHFRQVTQDVMTYCTTFEAPEEKKKKLKQEDNQEDQVEDFESKFEPEAAEAKKIATSNCNSTKVLTNV